MTLTTLIRNAEMLQSAMERGIFLQVVLNDRREDILHEQQVQLLEGKDSDGNDMRPYYSEDDYFSSREQAQWYINWKKSGISYPVDVPRNPDAPNLYINGKFHSELEVRAGSSSVGVYPKTPYAAGIVDKYGMSKFGLTQERWRKVLEESKDKILQLMKQELYE